MSQFFLCAFLFKKILEFTEIRNHLFNYPVSIDKALVLTAYGFLVFKNRARNLGRVKRLEKVGARVAFYAYVSNSVLGGLKLKVGDSRKHVAQIYN